MATKKTNKAAARPKAAGEPKGKGSKKPAKASAGTAKLGKSKTSGGGKKPKRISALDAAAQVLAKAARPMRAKELIAAMAEQGLWKSPGGKTPQATLYASMLREMATKGKAARFKKVDRGQFASTGKGS